MFNYFVCLFVLFAVDVKQQIFILSNLFCSVFFFFSSASKRVLMSYVMFYPTNISIVTEFLVCLSCFYACEWLGLC